MMPEPPDSVPRWVVGIETRLTKLADASERHDNHLRAMREDFTEIRDGFQRLTPRVEDHTGRIGKIEEKVHAQGERTANWQGLAKGVALVVTGLFAGATVVLTIIQMIK